MKKQAYFLRIFSGTLMPLALGLICLCSVPTYAIFDIEYPEISAPVALLMDGNHGEMLYEKNAQERAYPASTTKIMTALLVAEAIDQGILSLDTMITATEASQADLSIYGSTQGISPGEEMSVADLLHCLMLASANEAGNILAIAVSGDLETFVAQMNAKAQEIGCTGSNFMNTHGLHDDQHYTTAYDLYLIFQNAMSYPVFADCVGTSSYTTQPTNLSEERFFYNTNGLMSEWYYRGYSYSNCIGGKTGSTPEAGRCLVSGAVFGTEFVISVVLGTEPQILEDGSTLLPQFAESKALLQLGIDRFDRQTLSPGNDPVGQVEVTLSDDTDTVLVKAQGEITKTLPVGMDLSAIEMDVVMEVETVEAPVMAGTKMGTMSLSHKGELYGVLDVVAVNDVSRSEILYRKQQMENFVSDWGIYMAAAAVGIGGAMVGVQVAMEKRRRKHSWRNNQKKHYKGKSNVKAKQRK